MSYRVRLQNFEGPLDLLLFLIKKNEVDIYNIPIALITKQFLEYLELITTLDLEGASEFIYLAATLIRIKAQMLLPRDDNGEDEDEEDPRMELVQRLLEYKRFKDVTPNLAEHERTQRDYYGRTYFKFDIADIDETLDDSLTDVTLFQLMEVFRRTLENAPKTTFHRVEIDPVTVEEQIDYIVNMLEAKRHVLFSDIMANLKERLIIIVTFLAILELIRREKILIKQAAPFEEIWIQIK
ncbi:segregation/condensation protein A [candidate division KSB1 bacterium]|nr:segregation/condensation protein A [candidate division KSB1 bacterium]